MKGDGPLSVPVGFPDRRARPSAQSAPGSATVGGGRKPTATPPALPVLASSLRRPAGPIPWAAGHLPADEKIIDSTTKYALIAAIAGKNISTARPRAGRSVKAAASSLREHGGENDPSLARSRNAPTDPRGSSKRLLLNK